MGNGSEHHGHRQRMKGRFLSQGFDGFLPHEILETILYYCVPRVDTNPLAHRLLDAFGSISAVFDAPFDALIKEGLSENAAVYLKMLPEISRVYMEDKHNNRSKIVNMQDIGAHIRPKFIGRDNEVVVLLLMDSKGKELFCGVVSKGSLNSTDVPIRSVVNYALRYNAYSAVIAHNHPSGVAVPSRDDLRATSQISKALALVSVRLIDHIIFADNEYVSLADSKFDPGLFYTD